ncbi:MAG: hypothetical protein KA003_22470 [Caldilineaceae bacterium]|nr:hypothetical protein [Caldilineaceae bacterium]MBP8125201.1 hypothetical protein [Caldilineaceae bacterium]
MMRWRRFWRMAPAYLRSVARRERQLILLALVGLAPGVGVLMAWLNLAVQVGTGAGTGKIFVQGWLLPPLLLDVIGPAGVLVGAGVVTVLIGGLGLANAYLASVERRQGELALFLALGLNRWELAAILLLESLATGLLGSGVGLVLGVGISRLSWPAAVDYFGLTGAYALSPLAVGVAGLTGLLAGVMFMGISVLAATGFSAAQTLRSTPRPILAGMQALRTSVYGTIFAAVLTLVPALAVLGGRAALALTAIALGLSVLLTAAGWTVTRLTFLLPTPGHAPLWSLAVQGLARHPRHTAGMSLALITGAYSVGLAALAWLDGGVRSGFAFWVAGGVLTAGAGLVLTAAALAAWERRQEYALLVALGARPGRVRRLILLEYAIVALGAGSLGGIMALVNWAGSSGRGNGWLAVGIILADLLGALLSAWVGAGPVWWRVGRKRR